jgi:hypothetical protein
MGFDDKLASLGQFLSTLTWKKIFQFTVLVIIIIITWVIYKTTDQIVEYIRRDKIENGAPKIKTISPKTIHEIDSIASKSDMVAGIGITVVNFQKNTRYMIYFTGYTRELRQEFIKHNLIVQEFPAFTQNAMQNQRLIDLINGEFNCYDFSTSILLLQIPSLQDKIAYSCVNSIPPYYGKFVGMITIYLKRPPTSEEVDQLRVMSNILSEIIYDRELK